MNHQRIATSVRKCGRATCCLKSSEMRVENGDLRCSDVVVSQRPERQVLADEQVTPAASDF